MLQNDIDNSLGTVANAANTRVLFRAVERHHKNNPQISMEAAFEYIMSNSATFRALPDACIEKARRYPALPGIKDTNVESKKASSDKAKTIYADLNEALQELADSGQPLFITPLGPPDSEGVTPVRWECNGIPTFDIKEALESMGMPLYSVEFREGGPQAKAQSTDRREPIRPGTTVVHAERIVVNDKKLIKILSIENVQTKQDLPAEYISSYPNYYRIQASNSISMVESASRSMSIGDYVILSIDNFDQIIKTMKEASTRLSKINKTAKLEKEHSGKFTVSI